MKGRSFDITLLSPAPPGAKEKFAEELEGSADEFQCWAEPRRGRGFKVLRMRHLFSKLPIPVRTDRSTKGTSAIQAALGNSPDIVVFDFLHAAVLAPQNIPVASVLFTHNIESEIFRRHLKVATSLPVKALWQNQLAKMEAFERQTLQRFGAVVAVSDRDKTYFEERYDAKNVFLIRTGVDLDYFTYAPPKTEKTVVFLGAMDWLANIDGVSYFMDEVWPLIAKRSPDAKMMVVGRDPPSFLVKKARSLKLAWTFTDFVEDVRPYIHNASVCVIPLRVGGGTRIKVFEAMAMGCPVVSSTIGVEGLPVVDGQHYLNADSPVQFAEAVDKLLRDRALRESLSKAARSHVESNFSSTAAAQDFEEVCLQVTVRAPGKMCARQKN
jgi:glycosyltransferase involved in cell wall biosynthesis